MLLRSGIVFSPLQSPSPSHSLRLTKSHTHPHKIISAQSQIPPSYTISDGALQSQGFVLHRTTSTLNLDHLNSVFVSVGFPRRDPDKIRVALEHTDSLVWVENVKTQRPVAFARSTGDGVFNAIIWDVVVDPTFQGIGLGKAVMERLLEDLLQKGITNIALYSEPRVLGFYRPMGFVVDPDGITGMVYSRKQNKNRKKF
ncbi:GCN5-related N-acetyltransferase 1, chloroplastic [Amaranthus tricolor]|uniref:GCN5-related N-acetyltransferase 1, chloroplastic n=1 Tax=Amaranthus tricolor TaxID=29722 RepID=UPI00258B9E02|nr:GCN5-related N-acetyltransferase 1, chloroplastic [Amaranthus tricolor]